MPPIKAALLHPGRNEHHPSNRTPARPPNEVNAIEDRLYDYNSHAMDAMMAKAWAL
jgi:hypothetical protein